MKNLVSSKDLKKKERGHFDFTCDGKVHVTKWHDNSIVHVASTQFFHEPLKETRRWGKTGLNTVPQPYSIHKYNQGMGGVDLFDRLLSSYRPIIRSKKWWWPLFSHCLNASVIAAWLIHCRMATEKLVNAFGFQAPNHTHFAERISASVQEWPQCPIAP